jgi:hypothetical protein
LKPSANSLPDVAGPADGALAVVFVADDGHTAELTLVELQGCLDCVVYFHDEGGFGIAPPGLPGKAQAKGVIEIQVK